MAGRPLRAGGAGEEDMEGGGGAGGGGGVPFDAYASYDDYLDSQISAQDMFYLEVCSQGPLSRFRFAF